MDYAITETKTLLAQTAQGRLGSADFVGGPVVAIAAVAVVVGCLFCSSVKAPLPALGWAAAFLALAIYQDVTRLRIPNWLTLPALLAPVAAAGITAGAEALGASLLGAFTALGLLFIPFTLGWLGAGDVKAVIVLGALWGAATIAGALWWMVVAGGVLAIVVTTIQGGLGELLLRWFNSARHSLLCGQLIYHGAPAGSSARSGLPFAVAMGFGAVAYQVWGSPWM